MNRILLIGLLLLSSMASYAQVFSLQGVEKFRSTAITPINADGEVKGYIMYSKNGRADRKNDNYVLSILDQDLNKVKDITLQKPKKSYALFDHAFNGKAFCFSFYNLRKRYLELISFDASLNQMGTTILDDLSMADKSMIEQKLSGAEMSMGIVGGVGLQPVPDKGFIQMSMNGMGRSFNLEMLDNSLKRVWLNEPENKPEDYEGLGLSEATDQYAIGILMRRPGMVSTKITSYIVAYDLKTGEKSLEVPVETDGQDRLAPNMLKYDQQRNEFMIFGQYYDLDAKAGVHDSNGLFIKRLNKEGQVKHAAYYSWGNDINPLVPSEGKENLEDNYINYVHQVLPRTDGTTYFLAEQFKVGGFGVGAKKIKIGDLMLYKVNADKELEKLHYYNKEETDVFLPNGVGLYGDGLIGNMVKYLNGFDFQHMQQRSGSEDFTFSFLSYEDKKKLDKADLVSVYVDKKGNTTQDAIPLSVDKHSSVHIYPAKLGFNMVTTFNSKTEELELKLIKLNI